MSMVENSKSTCLIQRTFIVKGSKYPGAFEWDLLETDSGFQTNIVT